MAIVPERLWALMTPEERENIQSAVEGFLGPTFRCPSCQAEIRARVKLAFGATSLVTEEKTPPTASAPDELSPEERSIIHSAKASGMFDAYERALKEEKQELGPKGLDKIERLFLKFFNLAVPLDGCQNSKAVYRETYPGRLEFVQSNGVVGVSRDRVLVEFTPLKFFKVPKGSTAIKAPHLKAEQWIKTKFGYIPKGASAFAEAMRPKSLGAFGRLVQ